MSQPPRRTLLAVALGLVVLALDVDGSHVFLGSKSRSKGLSGVRLSSGFSAAVEKIGLLQEGKLKSTGKLKAMSHMDTSLLMVSSSATMLCKTAHSTWMHFREMDLKISDVTNPVELGLRSQLNLQPGDVDELEKRLQRDLKKSQSFVEKFQGQAKDLDDLWKSRKGDVLLNGKKRGDVGSLVQQVAAQGKKAIAQIATILAAMREPKSNGAKVVEMLQDYRDQMNYFDSLDPVLDDPPPKKKN
jgi:hypothetical protein